MKIAKYKSEVETRVQFRTTKSEKAYFERAADEFGFKSLSEYLRVSAHEKARKELPPEFSKQRFRKLSNKDAALVAKHLINPPEPNQKLKALFSKKTSKKNA